MRILYLSCHSILEYDEVSLLAELGHEVFSPGAYVEPENPGDASLRPGIPGLVYDPDVLEKFHRIGQAHPDKDAKDHLTKEILDCFDAVIVMHIPRWIQLNWEVMKGKRVIWRTIGQSIHPVEESLAKYRREGLQVVRYSPKERGIPGFIGQDAVIRFYKDPEDYRGWTGDNSRVITLAQHMQKRDSACNFTFFEEVTRPFSRHLFGPGNEASGEWASGAIPYEQLKHELRDNRAYFYTGTHPASYTLNFMEAFMTGIPIVAIGHERGNASYFPGHDLYEVPDFIEHGVNGFVSDRPAELQSAIRSLLSDKALAESVSASGRRHAVRLFGKETIKQQWADFLGE